METEEVIDIKDTQVIAVEETVIQIASEDSLSINEDLLKKSEDVPTKKEDDDDFQDDKSKKETNGRFRSPK